jgi:hypothetical protein
MSDVIAGVSNLAASCPARALLLRHGRVLATAEVGNDGGYILPRAHPADDDIVVVQQAGTCIRAAMSQAQHAPVNLPDAMTVTIAAVDPSPGAVIWCDPVALEGFPDDLLWCLRSGADATVMLHVAEWPATGRPIQLLLQSGTYRLSGGVIGLHPGQQSAALAQIISSEKMKVIADASGSVMLRINRNQVLNAEFGPNRLRPGR